MIAIKSYHELNGLKQQKLILSQFWRPEVQDEGAGRAVLSLEALGEEASLLPPASGDSRRF